MESDHYLICLKIGEMYEGAKARGSCLAVMYKGMKGDEVCSGGKMVE